MVKSVTLSDRLMEAVEAKYLETFKTRLDKAPANVVGQTLLLCTSKQHKSAGGSVAPAPWGFPQHCGNP